MVGRCGAAGEPFLIRLAHSRAEGPMPNRLLVAAVFVSMLAPALAAGQPASDWRYTQAGGLIGGAVMIGLTRASVAACGVGCDNDMSPGAELMLAGIGAAIGSLAGYAGDRLRGDTEPARTEE